MALAEILGEIEKTASSGLALVSPRVIETGVYAKKGHASAPDWLGALTGTSAGAAKGRLAAAERAAAVPELRRALRDGALSAPELTLLANAGAADPEAVRTLLGLVAERASHQELAAEADAAKAAARTRENERARRARVHAGRHLRWHQCESGGIRGEFFCDEVAWAKVAPRLEGATRARWRAAGAESEEPFEAYRLDAFLDLLGRSGTKDVTARPQCLVLVDAEALRRGSTSTGEICEIAGIGPVPVEAAIELLGQGSLQFLLKEGTDIRCVTKSSRDLAQKTAMALAAHVPGLCRPGLWQAPRSRRRPHRRIRARRADDVRQPGSHLPGPPRHEDLRKMDPVGRCRQMEVDATGPAAFSGSELSDSGG